MKPNKLEQIRRIREATKLLRTRRHVDACSCCREDLDKIESEADAPCAGPWLSHVARRIDQWENAHPERRGG